MSPLVTGAARSSLFYKKNVIQSQIVDFGGFGTKYSDPSTLPAGYGYAIDFTPSGDAIIISHQNSPYISAYPFDLTSGIGPKYPNPSVLPNGDGYSVRFSPLGDSVIAGSTNLYAYKWNSSTGFGTNYTYSVGGRIDKINFNPSGTICVFASGQGQAINWNSVTGFGSKYSNFGPGSANGTTFNKNGNVISIVSPYSTGMYVYAWNDISGAGTRYLPQPLPIGSYDITFSPSNSVIAAIYNPYPTYTPYLYCCQWNDSTGFGSKYSDPLSANNIGYGQCLRFSPTGNAIVVGGAGGVVAYPWSDSTGFGSLYNIPTLIKSGIDCQGIAFHPSGKAIAVLTGFKSPYFAVYASI